MAIPTLAISLLKNWKIMLFIGLIATIGLLSVVITNKNETIAELNREYGILVQSNQTLEDEINDQNSRIDELIVMGEAQQEKIRQSQKRINEINDDFQKELDRIEKEQVSNTCEGAMEWLWQKASK